MLEPQWATAQKAQATLEQNPADADANLALGRWCCFYKSDWPRGLPLLAKGTDERLKTLAQTELKPPAEGEEQAQLADGWWDQGSKELAVIRDVVRAHAAELYAASLPNLTEALRKVAVQRRIAEIANLQHPGAGPAKPAKPIVSRWMDILRLADTGRDARRGIWKRIGTDVGCQPLGLAVLDLPIELEDNYNLAVEFTRLSGVGEIGITFPVATRSTKVMLNMQQGQASGIDIVEGRRPTDPLNPTARRPGGIDNRHRHQLVISVRLIDPDQASIDVYMDGNQYLPHWTGRRSALAGGWGLPPKHVGIGGYDSAMVYHSVAVQKVTLPPAANFTPMPKTSLAPALKPSSATSLDGSTEASKFFSGQWVDLLRQVDSDRDAVRGNWTRHGQDVSCEAAEFARIGLPAEIGGSYDFEVEFTRTAGDSDVNFIYTVGSQQTMMMFSVFKGGASGFHQIDGKLLGNLPAYSKRPGTLVNGHRYRMLLSVRLPSPGRASVNVSLDGKPFLPHWEGDPKSLGFEANLWGLRSSRQLGLATYSVPVTFHSARMRVVSGQMAADPLGKGAAK